MNVGKTDFRWSWIWLTAQKAVLSWIVEFELSKATFVLESWEEKAGILLFVWTSVNKPSKLKIALPVPGIVTLPKLSV